MLVMVILKGDKRRGGRKWVVVEESEGAGGREGEVEEGGKRYGDGRGDGED